MHLVSIYTYLSRFHHAIGIQPGGLLGLSYRIMYYIVSDIQIMLLVLSDALGTPTVTGQRGSGGAQHSKRKCDDVPLVSIVHGFYCLNKGTVSAKWQRGKPAFGMGSCAFGVEKGVFGVERVYYSSPPLLPSA